MRSSTACAQQEYLHRFWCAVSPKASPMDTQSCLRTLLRCVTVTL